MNFKLILRKFGSILDLGMAQNRHETKGKQIALEYTKAKGGLALDLGCGDGYWSEQLKEKGYNVISVDQDTSYGQKVNLEFPLPFPSARFDLVWCTEVLEHLYKPEQLIREIHRVLKPRGRLILTTPNSHFWIYPILDFLGYSAQSVQNSDHKQFFSLKDIRLLFPEAQIYGYFPYCLVKKKITRLIGWLSPTFVVINDA